MARRFFSPTTGKIALAAAGAVLIGVAVSEAFDKPKVITRRRSLQNNPAPYRWNERRVRETVRQVRATGEADKAFVASEVCSRLFGKHPTGESVSFPPSPEAPDGVHCVWVLTVNLVDKMLGTSRSSPQETFVWTIHHPEDDDYPWEEPSLHPDNVPTPGMFFDAGAPTRMGATVDAEHDLEKTVRRALASALAMARMNVGLADGSSNTSKRLRKEMRGLIVGSDFHDKLYGQRDVAKAGGHDYALNEHGRGLNWDAVHADNMGLLAVDQPPRRTTDEYGNPVVVAQSAMLLWIPAVDLAALSDKVPTVQPYHWSDGTSTQEPPPVVARLGIDTGSAALSGGQVS